MALGRYFIRRLAFALVLAFVVSSGALLLTRVAPGDITAELVAAGVSREAIARERTRHGLDRPLAEQYLAWLAGAARLDFGTSMLYGRPVAALVASRALNSALLAVAALGTATLVGLPLGIVAGTRRSGLVTASIRCASLVLLSLPPLLTSLILVFVAARTGWLPVGGMTSSTQAAGSWAASVFDLALHLPLPALALALPIAATLERLQADAMTEAVLDPCILAARARGLPRSRVVWRHALRLSATPVASVYGLVIGGLLSGSFAVEIVTSWPGLGRLLYDALRARDLYLVAGCATAGAIFLAFGSLVSDIALAAVDPRIRVAGRT
ncbi:MAG: ABC transporter permease [Vicinamibacterales bacterium]